MENKYFITMEELIKMEREASHMSLIVDFLKHNKEVIMSILLDKLTSDTTSGVADIERYNSDHSESSAFPVSINALNTGIKRYTSNPNKSLIVPITINEDLFREITEKLNSKSTNRFLFEVGDDLEIDGVKIKYNFLEGFELNVIKIESNSNGEYTMELYLHYKIEIISNLNRIGNSIPSSICGSNCDNDAFKNSRYHNNTFKSSPIGLMGTSGPISLNIGCLGQPFTPQNSCNNNIKSAEPIFNDENFEIDLEKLEIERRICEIELNTSIVNVYQWFNFAKKHKLFNLAIHIKRIFNMNDVRVFD